MGAAREPAVRTRLRTLFAETKRGAKPTAVLSGDARAPLQGTVLERGVCYGLDFGAGYSPGLFLDQRENRQFVRRVGAPTNAELLRLHLFVFRRRRLWPARKP